MYRFSTTRQGLETTERRRLLEVQGPSEGYGPLFPVYPIITHRRGTEGVVGDGGGLPSGPVRDPKVIAHRGSDPEIRSGQGGVITTPTPNTPSGPRVLPPREGELSLSR